MNASPLLGRWYLVALTTLLVNDFWLKQMYPGAITGKLSDFAGVFAIAVFFAMLIPRRAEAVCVVIGALFIIWKLPQLTPLIEGWPVTRVADLTDTIALIVLPFVPRYVRTPPSPQRAAAIPVAFLSLFAFAATSLPRATIEIPDSDPLAAMEFRMTPAEFVARLDQCKMQPQFYEGESYVSFGYEARAGGKKRDAHAMAKIEQLTDSIRVSVFNIYVYRETAPVDEQPFRDELLMKIRGCIPDHFSFAIGPTLPPVARR